MWFIKELVNKTALSGLVLYLSLQLPILITNLLIVGFIVLPPPPPQELSGGVPVTSKGWEEVPLPAPVPSIYFFRWGTLGVCLPLLLLIPA